VVGISALVRRARGVIAIVLLGGVLAGPAVAGVHGLEWGGRHFSNPLVFRDWLSARGQTYAAWAAHHPAGLAIIERTPLPEPLAPGPAIRLAPSTGHAWPGWLSPALIAVAAVLCLSAAFPVRVLEEHGLVFLLPVRYGLLAAGIAVLVVVFVASTLN
jgi:hypothetical protein